VCKTLLQNSLLYRHPLPSLGPLQYLHQHTAASMACKEVSKLSDAQVAEWFNSFDTVMTDCDGVLWVGAEAIPGSPDMVQRFRALGKRVFYVTNNSTKHRREYKTKVDKLGFGGDLEEIVGTAYLAAAYLEQVGFDKNKLVYVVGSTGITQELDDVGIKYLPIGPDTVPDDGKWSLETLKFQPIPLNPDVGAVIAGFDINISFKKILKGASYANTPGAHFIATNTDEQFPMKGTDLIIPGTGSMVAAVATAAGRKPVVLGKPSKFMFEIVQKRHPAIEPERTLMIGDRANTDILLGKNCGLQTLLVGSGVHSLEQTRAWEVSEDQEERRMVADFYADKLGDLLDRVKSM